MPDVSPKQCVGRFVSHFFSDLTKETSQTCLILVWFRCNGQFKETIQDRILWNQYIYIYYNYIIYTIYIYTIYIYGCIRCVYVYTIHYDTMILPQALWNSRGIEHLGYSRQAATVSCLFSVASAGSELIGLDRLSSWVHQSWNPTKSTTNSRNAPPPELSVTKVLACVAESIVRKRERRPQWNVHQN